MKILIFDILFMLNMCSGNGDAGPSWQYVVHPMNRLLAYMRKGHIMWLTYLYAKVKKLYSSSFGYFMHITTSTFGILDFPNM